MKFSRHIQTALALSLAICLSASDARADAYILVNAGRGPVKVYYPDSYNPNEPLPLIMALHGYTSNGSGCENRFQLRQYVDSRRFIYFTPEGSINSQGWQYWNGTDVCCDYEDSNPDDSGYLQTLIAQISALLAVDTQRISSVGYSNGGFMSHRLACEVPELFASIVSIAGLNWQNPSNCPANEPVSVLQIHGTNDTIIPYSWGLNLGAESSARHWAGVGQCDTAPDLSLPNINLTTSIAGNETTRAIWRNCNPGGDSELWSVWGGTHSFNYVSDLGSLILDWIEARPKPLMSENYCQSGPNSLSSTGATIELGGYPSLSSNDLSLRAYPLPDGQFGIFFTGVSQQSPSVPFGNGYRCVRTLGLQRLNPAVQIQSWEANRALDLNAAPLNTLQAGDTRYFQFWYRDPSAGGAAFNLTDGLELTLWP